MDPLSRAEPIGEAATGTSPYDRDYTAILYSHAFRRLRHKTQVFFMPQNDHVCTRLDHVLYVAAIAERVSRALKQGYPQCACDPLLARAIALGHDLGHPPFGHKGEEALRELARPIGGFRHETHGLRIVDKIEAPRPRSPAIGLNLTVAVRNGIVNHCGEDKATRLSPDPGWGMEGKSMPATLEGCVVRLVDKVAYLGRDIEDAVTALFLRDADVPGRIAGKIGSRNGEIVDYFVTDIIDHSSPAQVGLSDDAATDMQVLMDFNYKNIYENDRIGDYACKVKDIVEVLFDKFCKIQAEFGDDIGRYMKRRDMPAVQVFGKFLQERSALYYSEEKYNNEVDRRTRIVIDFLATLTDRFALDAIQQFYSPTPII